MAKEYAVTTNTEALLYRIWKGLTAGGIIPASPTNNAIGQGRKVVASSGTAVVLGSGACKSITVQSEKDNTSDIVVGGSGVVASLSTREGIYLSPGDSVDLPIDNLDKVYVDALVNGEGVTYVYFN